MITILIGYVLVLFALCWGYWLYRKWRLSIIVNCAKRLHSESDVQGYIDGHPYRLVNDRTPIYGYQPRVESDHKRLPPPGLYTVAVGRYVPDTDTWEPAPYVRDEHEEVVSEMLQVEVL